MVIRREQCAPEHHDFSSADPIGKPTENRRSDSKTDKNQGNSLSGDILIHTEMLQM